jgi:hypothetical protein
MVMSGQNSCSERWLYLAATFKGLGLSALLVGCAMPLYALLIDREPPKGWLDYRDAVVVLAVATFLSFATVMFAIVCLMIRWNLRPLGPPIRGDDEDDRDSDWGKGPPWSPSLVPAPRRPPSLAAHAVPPVD